MIEFDFLRKDLRRHVKKLSPSINSKVFSFFIRDSETQLKYRRINKSLDVSTRFRPIEKEIFSMITKTDPFERLMIRIDEDQTSFIKKFD